MQPNKQLSRPVCRWFLLLWLVLTLPVVMVLVINSQTRFVFFETLAHWRSKVLPLKYVFVGDSITAGGRNWGWRLWHNPLAARNLAGNGYTVWQIEGQVGTAINQYHPKVIFMLAGTNDLLGRGGVDQAISDYHDVLHTIQDAHTKLIITLVPYEKTGAKTADITKFNNELEQLCREDKIEYVDLNPVIAPAGNLLPQYTVDGIHFTEATYSVWCKKLHEVLERTSING